METRKIQEICLSHGVSLAAAALQFPLAHLAVTSVIPGGAKPEQVTQNISSAQAHIPAKLWQDLMQSGLIETDAPVPDLRWQPASRSPLVWHSFPHTLE